MGKKKADEMEKQKEKFLEGAKKNKVSLSKAKRLFELMAKFAEYGFNKSHSAAYALIAYQTAYLKTHYPVEFMAALLTCEMGNSDKITRHIGECRERGIEILPPDINESERDFTVVEDKIRFGLAAIKNVGSAAIESILNARREGGRFLSFFDFCKRIDTRKVNKKVIESLIKCGAFDCLGKKRAQLMAILDEALEKAQKAQRQKESKQKSLFSSFNIESKDDFSYPDISEWTETERLSYEKESLGFYITGHPLNKYLSKIKAITDTNTLELYTSIEPNKDICIGGIVTNIREIKTRKGDIMCFFNLEDIHGAIEIIIFPELYHQISSIIQSEEPILVWGKTEIDTETPRIIAKRIQRLSDIILDSGYSIHVVCEAEELSDTKLNQLKEIIENNPGSSPIYLHLRFPNEGERVLSLGKKYRSNANEVFLKKVTSLFGEGKVSIRNV